MDDQSQMIMSIVTAINTLFDKESELKSYEWDKIDLTQFFTAYIKAGNYMFNQLTDEDKNNLEFTYMANQLIVQSLLEDSEAA